MYTYLFKNMLFPFYESVLRQRKTLKYFGSLKESQWESAEEIKKRQWEALKQLLDHAYGESEFYRGLFDKAGIMPKEIESYSDFKRLPIISKDEIRQNKDSMIAKSFKGRVFHKATGGSTGEPLQLAHDRDSYEWRTAVALRGYNWAKCEDGRKIVYIWGEPIGKQSFLRKLKVNLHNAFLRRKIISSFRFDEAKMREAVDYINQARPEGMVGYTTAVYNLAKFIKEKDLKCIAIKNIVTGAEKVHEHQRDLIEEVFQGKVFNTYGCREFMLIASECGEHKGLHINSENLFVEILKNGKPAKPGEVGEIVITDLHNYGMPFIRYKNGDLAVASDRICACGRRLPLLEDIEGRVLDTIQTVDGRFVPGEYFPHLMKDFDEVKQFQVVQESKEKVIVNIVKNKEFSKDRFSFLQGEIQKILGEEVKVDYLFKENIALTPMGKFRVTVSHIPVNFNS